MKLKIAFPLALLSPNIAFAGVASFHCLFSLACIPDSGCKPETLELSYKLDEITGEAFVEGNNGISSVAMHTGDEGYTFLEELRSGSVQSTTASKQGAAVHSRHTIIFGKLSASQYHGFCTVSRIDEGN